MDPSETNRHRFRELGGFTKLMRWLKTNSTYNAMTACNLQNVVSTQTPEQNRQELVSLGYIPITIQSMKDFRTHSCARGEAVWDIANLFLHIPEWVNEFYERGIIEQAIALLRDEPDENDAGRSLDPLGPDNRAGMCRTLHSSMRVLVGVASKNATRRAAVVKAGVFDEIATMLQRVGDLRYRSVWGQDFDVVAQACQTLHDLADDGSETDRATLKQSGALDVVTTLMARLARGELAWQVCNMLLSRKF